MTTDLAALDRRALAIAAERHGNAFLRALGLALLRACEAEAQRLLSAFHAEFQAVWDRETR